MKVRQGLCLFLVLGIPVTAAAQNHPGRQTRPGGTAPHPGPAHRQQPHMITPEMQHEHMMQQFWREQMMLNEMMSQPRGRGAHTQSRSSTGKAKSTNDAPAGKQIHHNNERPALKNHSKDANAASKRKLAADQRSVSLLRTVHNKLRVADHDYQGHRVRAMNHISSALEHLGSPAFNSDSAQHFGLGNLPQSKSDEILRDALIHLKTAESELTSGTNHPAYHGNARSKVAEAIGELHVALNIR
jgi:hypothetical protein